MRLLALTTVALATALLLPGQATVSPAAPDARLGAGGVRGRGGNIVYPGTPGAARVGNIVSPGLPTPPPGPPNILEPGGRSTGDDGARPPSVAPADEPKDHPRRGRRGRGGVFLPIQTPIYGLWDTALAPNVIQVPPGVATRSSAEHVIRVGEAAPAAETPATETAAEGRPAETPPEYWLIALRGGLIYAAKDFEVEPHAVWFITMQGDEYIVPRQEVDAVFSRKLNAERGVEIDLELP